MRITRNAAGGSRALVAGAALGLLAACGGAPAPQSQPQQWQGLAVTVESRPSPPRAGMNEFLVTVTDPRGRPGYDLLVSMRASDREPWTQAIQDGQMGVYRRAVSIDPAADKTLQVRLQGKEGAGVLQFPLAAQP